MKNNYVIAKAMKFFRMIGILFVVSLTMDRCGMDCRECPDVESFKYTISSFSITPLNREQLLKIMNNIQQAGNMIEFRKDFGVNFLFETEQIANRKPVHSLFIQSAYACKCPAPMFYPKDSIVSIQIYSDKSFDETHPAGANIAEFFKIDEFSQLTSFEDYLKYTAPAFTSLFPYSWFRCVLTATTIEEGEYEFTFVVGLSDDRILEQSIKTILE